MGALWTTVSGLNRCLIIFWIDFRTICFFRDEWNISIFRNEKVLSPKCVKSEFWHSCPSCFILQGIYISDHISFAICHDNCIFTIFVIILICYLPYLTIVQQSLTCGRIYRNHCFRSWHIFIPGYGYVYKEYWTCTTHSFHFCYKAELKKIFVSCGYIWIAWIAWMFLFIHMTWTSFREGTSLLVPINFPCLLHVNHNKSVMLESSITIMFT